MLFLSNLDTLFFLRTKKFIFLLLAFCLANLPFATANAQIFPEGSYRLTGFSVEKNGQVLFDNSQVYSFSSSLKVRNISKDVVQFNGSVKIKPKANAAEMSDSREDRFKVIWETERTGQLKNLNPRLKLDESTFILEEGKFIVRSWIQRHGTWETQYYEKR
jgi:hypothetical protein